MNSRKIAIHSFSFRQVNILLLFLACNCSVALANGFSFSTATDFTTGNYGGASSTDIWYVPFTARYDKDRASFRVIIPYLHVTGPGNVLGPGIGGVDGRGILIGGGLGGGGVIVCDEKNDDCTNNTPRQQSNTSRQQGGNDSASGGSGSGGDSSISKSGKSSGEGDNESERGSGRDDASEDVIKEARQNNISALGLTGGIPLGGSSLAKSTQSGLGDIITAFSYNLIDHVPTGIVFDITARLKIPTANASQNLGSGQVDYAVQGDLFKAISKFIFNATFGYRILGNPSGITFHNVLYGAAGMAYRLSPDSTIGTSFNIGQSTVRLQDSRDLTLYLSHRVSDRFRLNIYGLRGFSERSPDWGGGLNLRYIF
jgi:hypothetical protein